MVPGPFAISIDGSNDKEALQPVIVRIFNDSLGTRFFDVSHIWERQQQLRAFLKLWTHHCSLELYYGDVAADRGDGCYCGVRAFF